MKRIAALVLVVHAVLLLGCGGGGTGTGGNDSGNPGASAVYASGQSGVAQKGPLIMGSTVTVQELNASLNPTGKQYTFQITSNLGTFSANASFTSNLVGIIAAGYYFDEVRNAVSSGPITLQSYADLSVDSALNVNLLTTLAYGREKKLVDAGYTLAAARQTAEKEVLAAFHIRNAGQFPSFGQLDLSNSGDANRILAAISSVLVNGQTPGTLASLIAAFQSDLADNGVIDDVSTLATINASMASLDTASVASNLNGSYRSVGLSLTAVDINNWIDRDSDGVLGKFKFYQANALPSTAYTSPAYTAGADENNNLTTVSAGTLIVNGSPAPPTGAIVYSGDSLAIRLTSPANPQQSVTGYILSNGVKILRFTITVTSLPLTTVGVITGNGAPQTVRVTDDGKTLLLASVAPVRVSNDNLDVTGGGLYTYSLANPASPSPAGYILPTWGWGGDWAGIWSVGYSSATKTAFVSNEGRFEAFDLSTPASPVFKSGVLYGGAAVTLSPDKTRAYAANEKAIYQYDVTNPNNLVLMSQVQIPDPDARVLNLAVSPNGRQLLAGVTWDVWAIDISSGTLGTVTLLRYNGATAGYAGTYLGTGLAIVFQMTTLRVIDISTPSTPTVLGSVKLDYSGQPGGAGAATYLNATGLTYIVSNNVLYVVNTSDPTNPLVEGSVNLPSGWRGAGWGNLESIALTPNGKYAYVVSQGNLTVISLP